MNIRYNIERELIRIDDEVQDVLTEIEQALKRLSWGEHESAYARIEHAESILKELSKNLQ